MISNCHLCCVLLLACVFMRMVQCFPPHIIVILADDFGFDDVGFHGGKQIPTPNLDALAYDGIILNNYYVQPICTPSRAALMTGRHPTQLGLQVGVPLSSQPWGLGLNETILPQYLKPLGYVTRAVGKWHLGFYAKELTPTYRGFDTFYGFYNGHADYFDHSFLGAPSAGWGLDLHDDSHGSLAVDKKQFGVYSTELYTQHAVEIIANHDANKPLFLYLPHQAVHAGNENTRTPLEAPWKYVQRFQHIKDKGRRLYSAMVSAMDDGIGNVTRALHERGMLNSSIIVFSTDNGGPAAGYDRNHACNWPLRGMKYTQWEGGVRGAAFIWSPLLHQSGYTSKHMIQIEDLFPTILHGAGYDTSKLPAYLYGKDMWETLSHNGPQVRQEMLHNIDTKTKAKAIRMGEMKLISSGHSSNTVQHQGWYAPEQVIYEFNDDYVNLNHSDLQHNVQNILDEKNTHTIYDFVSDENNVKMSQPADNDQIVNTNLDLQDILVQLGRTTRKVQPALVQCGPKPSNASTNCQVDKQPCLYNITADPCEYNNLADVLPHVTQHLLSRLKYYEGQAAPSRKKPDDPRGNPKYHDGMWVPWITLSPEELEMMKAGSMV